MLSGSNAIPDWNGPIGNSLSNLRNDIVTSPSFKIITKPNFVLNWNRYYVVTSSNYVSDDDSFDC